MSWSKVDRKVQSRSQPMSAALAINMAPRMRVRDYLRERYGALRHATLRLAQVGNSTPRAARNWLDGECAPGFDGLVELMAADPDFEAVVLDIVRGRRAERGA